MDNSKDLAKVLEGLKAAQSILKTHITNDVLNELTPEQRQDYNKAIDNAQVIKSVKDLEKFVNNI